MKPTILTILLVGFAMSAFAEKPHTLKTFFIPDQPSTEEPAYVQVKEHSVVITANDGSWGPLELPRAGHTPIAPGLLEKMNRQKWPTAEQGLTEHLRKFIVNATRQ